MAPRFLVDGMLGSLARWLRITGYDTVYRNDAEDDALIDEAQASGRVLLTRDRVLAARARKQQVHVVLVELDGDKEQLAEIAVSQGLQLRTTISRCPNCNGQLSRVSKEEVEDQVPAASYEAFDEFWGCGSCGAVFWRGSHWPKIRSTVEEAQRIAESANCL